MDEYIKKQDVIDLIMSQPVDAHYPSWYADLVSKIPACKVKLARSCSNCKYFNSYDRNSLFGYCTRGGNFSIAYSTDYCGGFK